MQISSTSPSVLLVEPRDSNAKRFQDIFTKVARHWRLVRVADGASAVHHMIFEEYPELLVTSLQTPRMNALDIAEWLHYLKCPKTVSVLIYDSPPAESDRHLLAKLGVGEFLNANANEECVKKTLMRQVIRIETHFTPTAPEPLAPKRAMARSGFVRRYSE